MKIGFPNHPRRDVLEELAWVAENGFDFVDLFLEPDQGALECITPARIRRRLEELGLEAVGHLAPYLPIGSPLPQLRQAAGEVAGQYLEAFAEIGVPVVTVHAHWPPRLFSDTEGVAWQAESLERLVAVASDLGMQLMYEPLDTERDSAENIEAVLAKLPRLWCHLDLGHSNLHGRDLCEMIQRFAGRLCHIHAHDNDGRSDQHLPPGAGTIDWKSVVDTLRAVGYEGTITLEVFSRDRQYVLLAQRRMRELWEASAG